MHSCAIKPTVSLRCLAKKHGVIRGLQLFIDSFLLRRLTKEFGVIEGLKLFTRCCRKTKPFRRFRKKISKEGIWKSFRKGIFFELFVNLRLEMQTGNFSKQLQKRVKNLTKKEAMRVMCALEEHEREVSRTSKAPGLASTRYPCPRSSSCLACLACKTDNECSRPSAVGILSGGGVTCPFNRSIDVDDDEELVSIADSEQTTLAQNNVEARRVTPCAEHCSKRTFSVEADNASSKRRRLSTKKRICGNDEEPAL